MTIRLAYITIQQIYPAGKRYLPQFVCPRTSCFEFYLPPYLWGFGVGVLESAVLNSFSRGIDKLEQMF
jgi:hypothetical protein